MRFSIVLLAAALPVAALAQQIPAPQAPQPAVGFFQPKPGDDLSLSRTLPPEAYQPPAPGPTASAPAAAAPAPAPAAAPLVVVVPGGESQADRAEADAERARAAAARMPQPINGAFTGLTDERDR